jgi:MFS family permease
MPAQGPPAPRPTLAGVPFVADLRTVLRVRGFRQLFAVRLTSQGADGVFQVALASLVFFSPERAATPQAAAGAFAVTVLPYTLVGPFAGVLLDRWRRRQVLLVANAVRALLVLVVAAVLLTWSVGPALYVAVLVALSVNRFFLTALGASLPHVVVRHELVMANAVSPTSGTLAAIAGGGLGYLLRRGLPTGDLGDAILLSTSALGYLIASALALRIGADTLGPDDDPDDPRQTGWGAVAEGARAVRERPAAVQALAAVGVSRFGFGLTTIATILLCRNYFNDPANVAAGLALLAEAFGASALGFGLAAVVTPQATGRWGTGGWIWRCLLLAAVAEVMLLVHLSVPVALVAGVLLGLGVQGLKICVDAALQREVHDDVRGRVFALYDVVFNVAFVVAAALAALVVPRSGWSPLLVSAIAALYLVSGLVLALRPAGRSRAQPARRA